MQAGTIEEQGHTAVAVADEQQMFFTMMEFMTGERYGYIPGGNSNVFQGGTRNLRQASLEDIEMMETCLAFAGVEL